MSLSNLLRHILLVILLFGSSTSLWSWSQAEEQSVEGAANTGISAAIGELTENNSAAFYKRVNLSSQTIGRTMAVLDVGNKLYSGQEKEAALSATMTILSEWSGSEGGKAVLAVAGISSITVNSLILAIQVYRTSEQELSSATNARKLETLYGNIGSDPYLHSLNRNLGEGDPFPVTPETVDYVWRKVLEGSWRSFFKVYVTEILQEPWPETSTWDSLTRSVASNTADINEKLKADEKAYKGYIAYLLGDMNKVAKHEESRVVAKRILQQLQDKLGRLGRSEVIRRYYEAKKKLPEVKTFVNGQCQSYIKKTLATHDLDGAATAMSKAWYYRYEVLAYIPKSGKLAAKHSTLMSGLKNCHSRAEAARDTALAFKQREQGRIAAEAPTTRWQAVHVGFSLTLDGLKQAIQKEFYETGMIVNSLKPVETAWEQTKHGYTQQSDRFVEECKRDNSCDSKEADAFSKQFDAYLEIDELAYSKLNSDISAFEQSLVYAKKQKEYQYDVLFRELDAAEPGMMDLVSTAENAAPVIDYEGYVGVTWVLPPLTRSEKGSPGADRMLDYLTDLHPLTDNIIREYRYNMDKLSSILSFDIAHYRNAFIRYSDRYEALRRRISDENIPVLKTKKLKRLKSYTKSLEEHRRFLKNIQEAQEEARVLMPKLQQDYDNRNKDAFYVKYLLSIVYQYEKIYLDFRSQYKFWHAKKLFNPLLFPEMVKNDKGPDCDAQIKVGTPYMKKGDIDEAKALFKDRLEAAKVHWLDEHYKIGLKPKIGDLFSLLNFDTYVAPEHYMVYKFQDECAFASPAEIKLMREPLDKVVDDFDALPWLNVKKESYDGYYSYFVRVVRKSNTSVKPHEHAGASDALMHDFKTIKTHISDAEMKREVSALVKQYERAVQRYKEYLIRRAYAYKQFKQYAALSSQFDRVNYDLNKVNMDVKDNSKLQQLANETLQKGEVVAGFVKARINDMDLPKPDRDNYARIDKKLQNQLFFLREFKRNLDNRSTPSDQHDISAATDAITRFYAHFKEAYENKDAPSLLDMISTEWQSEADGTTLGDLEANLNNSFNLFDEISVNISDIRVAATDRSDRFKVTYSLDITGYIYDEDITHEENSKVSEVVTVKGDEVKILKTLSGRFWYIH